MSIFWQVAYPGMRIVAKRDSDGYTRAGHPIEGTFGTCVKPGRFTIYKARWGIDAYFYKPGVYETDGNWEVQWDTILTNADGSHSEDLMGPLVSVDTYNVDVHHDCLQHYNMRYQALWVIPVLKKKTVDSTLQECSLKHVLRVGELPETKFWEDDIAVASGKCQKFHTDNIGCKRRIRSIDYHMDVNDRGRCYNIEWVNDDGSVNSSGGTSYGRDDDMELVERGNLWKYYHNEPLKFRDLQHELSFHDNIGKVREIPNPETGLYRWDHINDILKAIEDGVVDGIGASQALFGSSTKNSAIRCEDRELGKRVRAATLAGFNVEV